MKRKKLQFSLVLITIVLGGLLMSFSEKGDAKKLTSSTPDNGSVVNGIKASAEYISAIRNNQYTGLIAPEDLVNVSEQMKQFKNSRSEGLDWKMLGPDNYGGPTRAILFDNTDASNKTIISAGVTGGLWKSTDLGISWHIINETNSNLNVTCLVQSADGKIYAGTGNDFGVTGGLSQMGFNTGFVGQGLFMSTDGDEFTLIPSTQPTLNDVNSDWVFISKLAIDENSGRIFAATNTGLKYSADGGDTWNVVKDTSGVELVAYAKDVKVASNGTIAACIDNEAFISDGDPNKFVNKSTGDSLSLPSDKASRIEFAFSQSEPSILYTSIIAKDGNLLGIYKSVDAGNEWDIILPYSHLNNIFLGGGYYCNAITVFPENPDKVLLGGIDAWEGELIQETGLYAWKSISTNFMPNFFPNYLHAYQHSFVFQPESNSKFFIGNDGGISIGNYIEGDYSFETSNRSYFTTQFYNIAASGVMNYNLGGSQNNGNVLITGVGNTIKQGESIYGAVGGPCAISKISKEVMVFGSTFGDIQRSDDAGENLSTQFLTDAMVSSFESYYFTPLTLWESFDNHNSRDSIVYNATVDMPVDTTIQVRSDNSGQPFYYTFVDPLSTGDSISIQDIVSSRLFIATDRKVYMTKELHDFGKTPEWFEVSNAQAGFIGTAQTVGLSSDGNHLFVGTQDGKVFRISNLALAYNYERADVNSPECIVSTKEIISNSVTNDQVITSISVDADNPANVMVTLGNYGNEQYVLYSQNALDENPTFTSRQGNLPAMPVYSSVIEMTNSDIAIIGTEHGIFRTENIKAESPVWEVQNSTISSVPVFDLEQQIVSKTSDTVYLQNGAEITKVAYSGTNNYGVIYAATFGKGLFRCNDFRKPVGIDEDNNNPVASEKLAIAIYPNPVSDYASIELESASNDMATINVYDLSGRKVFVSNRGVDKGINKINVDFSPLKTGTYVVQIFIGENVYSDKFIVK